MIPDHMEPIGLHRDASPLADFMAMASMRTDAETGSEKLRKALLRAHLRNTPPPPPRRHQPYGTIHERRLAASQIGRLIETVATFYGISRSLLTSPTRGPQEISDKRQVAMYLARNVIRCSFPSIAKEFGRKDHTTVIHACNVVESDPKLKAQADALRARIRA